MSFDAAALPGDVLGLGKIHFEEEARASSERQKIVRGWFRQRARGAECRLNGGFIGNGEPRLCYCLRRVKAERGPERLAELLAPAMTVHVAVSTEVHYNIEHIGPATEAA